MATAPPLEYAKIEAILKELDSPQKPPVENRRRADRIALRAALTAIVLQPPDFTRVQIFSRNISTSGMGFVSRTRFVTDQRIIISLKVKNLTLKLILAQIVHSHAVRPGLFHMGARFLECVGNPDGTEAFPQHWLSPAPGAKGGGRVAAGPCPAPNSTIPATASATQGTQAGSSLPSAAKISTHAAAGNPQGAKSAIPAKSATVAVPLEPDSADWPSLLSRERTLERLEHVAGGKTIAGVVARVIAAASSPRADLGDIVQVIQSDPILASRVLQLANSAATGGRKRINNIEDATRTLGVRGIQNMAISIGIFGTFPPDELDGFSTMRCWQHSFAVGELMAAIVRQRDPEKEGLNHLVGLCHDLGDILLRQHFAEEYETILNFALAHEVGVHRVESVALGIRHPELISILLNRMGLPVNVVGEIREFYERQIRGQAGGMSKEVQILNMANLVAHGLLLAASNQELIRPILRTEWRSLETDKAPPVLEPLSKRGEILMTTNTLAKLPAKDEERLFQPIIPRTQRRIAYVRPEVFIELDPLAFALQLSADTQILTSMPTGDQWNNIDGLVVVGLHPGTLPTIPSEITKALAAAGRQDLSTLVLVGTEVPQTVQGQMVMRSYPLRLVDLQEWLEKPLL